MEAGAPVVSVSGFGSKMGADLGQGRPIGAHMTDVANTACIFCGTTGAAVKITKEHTFSDWINDVLTPADLGPDITCERSISQGPGAGTVTSWPVAQVASHKVRAVCQPCNGGWMSGHEGQIRSVLEPMIRGYNASLTPDQQISVATWTSMKAAVFEYVWSDEPVLTAADRSVIMTQARPPASAQVRLAAIESQGRPLQAMAHRYPTSGAEEVAYCLTLTIGCLVLQFFGGPGAGNHKFQDIGRPRADFAGIYPPCMQVINWPPALALDDVSVQDFADPLRALLRPAGGPAL